MFAVADLPANMQNKITVNGDCWDWTGAKNNRGYGSTSAGRKGKSMLAHRKSYTLTRGDIPDGYEIDHLCENTLCVNPRHLEAVTPGEHRDRIGHKDLRPIYAAEREVDPGIRAILDNFIAQAEGWMRRRDAMSPEDRAEDDSRRHRLHVATNVRCVCDLKSVLA